MTTERLITGWNKLGKIFTPPSGIWWMHSYTMIPTVLKVEKDRYRVFFSGRNDRNHSHIGYFDFDPQRPFDILTVPEEPVLSPGELGCFDGDGVTPSCVVEQGGKQWLYYIGWNQRSRVRMSLIAGLAISEDQGRTFRRVSRGPLLERTDQEPFSILTAPYVLVEGDRWQMWYVSGIGWINEDLPKYNIKYAESTDGINWKREGRVCIELKAGEHALARPCVLREDGIYKMWYSYKGENYRMGYAESPDGLNWTRKDQEAGIDVSPSGWDSQMIEYGYVFNHQGKKYMLYNGNDYGKDGIGLAVLDKEHRS